ncbi:MAG TPA: cyclic nucleotide-binding domain-containing protein, partial [Polyangiaceae bacterium]|nr:cyclic nucleotide-binding domain-containing protein [Polyangiaceae bacterium]
MRSFHMTPVNPRSVLDGTALFANVSEFWRERLASLAHLASFSAEQVIFGEGDAVPGLYCVSTGLVRVAKEGPRGKQLVLHFAQPGQTFAEVAVFGNFVAPAS